MNNPNFLEDVTKKLIPIAKQRDIESQLEEKREKNEITMLKIEKMIANRINNQKSMEFCLEEKTLNQIELILNCFSKLNPSTLNFLNSSFSLKENKEIQTEKDETQILIEKYNSLEKEYQNINTMKDKLTKENQILLKENEELKGSEQKLTKENKLLENSIEEMTKKNLENTKIIQNLQMENKKLNDIIIDNNNKISELIKSKMLLEDKIKADLEKKQYKEKMIYNSYNGSNKFYALLNSQNLNKIITFLNYEEICNLKLTSKAISIEIANSADILRNFYSKIITEKNKKISELQKYEIKKEYLVNNTKLETLIKDYAVLNNRLVGKDLKSSIGRCLNFINKDVRVALGFQPAKIKGSNETSGSSTPSYFRSQTQMESNVNASYTSSLFGGFKNMFGFGGAENTNLSQSQQGYYSPDRRRIPQQESFSKLNKSQTNSLTSSFMCRNAEEFEKYLNESEQTITNELDDSDLGITSNYEFDFSSPDDIRLYLHRFLKGSFSADKLTSFIKELAFGYSELLFYSKKTLFEVKELQLVKCALNERFKFYQKIATDYEKKFGVEVEEINKRKNRENNVYTNSKNNNIITMQTIKGEEELKQEMLDENDKLKNEIEDKKSNIVSLQTKANLYKRKYEDVMVDFQLYKTVFGREHKNLKYLYEKALNEKNELEKKIEEFQKFFEETMNS